MMGFIYVYVCVWVYFRIVYEYFPRPTVLCMVGMTGEGGAIHNMGGLSNFLYVPLQSERCFTGYDNGDWTYKTDVPQDRWRIHPCMHRAVYTLGQRTYSQRAAAIHCMAAMQHSSQHICVHQCV